MILVDTSIWVDHLNHRNDVMLKLLADGDVLMHAFIIGEIALGTLRQRDVILRRLGELPFALKATDTEVMNLIQSHRLDGRGIGFVDAHLLASCLITDRAYLWTRDRRLAALAERLAVDASTA